MGMAAFGGRRKLRGPVATRLAQEQDSQWVTRAGVTFLRQAGIALLLFGLVSFVVATNQPYLPVVERVLRHAVEADYTYQDVLDWAAGARQWRIPTTWTGLIEVIRTWRTSPVSTNGSDASGWSIVWPAQGPITSSFGWRTHPIYNDLRYHTGVDIAAPADTSVVAARAGKVADVGENELWGNYVLVEHDEQNSTFYAHLARVVVSEGQNVTQGAILGTVGSTGQASSAHLHFEMREKDLPIDPEPLLRAVGGGS